MLLILKPFSSLMIVSPSTLSHMLQTTTPPSFTMITCSSSFFAIINVVAENLDWVWGLLASLVKYMFH